MRTRIPLRPTYLLRLVRAADFWIPHPPPALAAALSSAPEVVAVPWRPSQDSIHVDAWDLLSLRIDTSWMARQIFWSLHQLIAASSLGHRGKIERPGFFPGARSENLTYRRDDCHTLPHSSCVGESP
ncbi:hypothetical protein KC336_g44 [Hortaea werneckii]|nr:hypothetical protein KC336_g44 [Hortaea werneckii]